MIQLAKVIRIGTMARSILAEVQSLDLDEAGRGKVRQVYDLAVEELKSGLDTQLGAELERLTAPFRTEAVPTAADLRVAHAQLVGWLEGVLQMVQVTQALAAQSRELQAAQQVAGQQAAQQHATQRGLPSGPQRPVPPTPAAVPHQPGGPRVGGPYL